MSQSDTDVPVQQHAEAADTQSVCPTLQSGENGTPTSPYSHSKSGYQAKSQKRPFAKQSLADRAAAAKMPTPAEAELVPKFMYEESLFHVHLCDRCRAVNRTLPVINVDEEHQQIELQLCRICRATFNAQRKVKFFKHELLCLKRENDGPPPPKKAAG